MDARIILSNLQPLCARPLRSLERRLGVPPNRMPGDDKANVWKVTRHIARRQVERPAKSHPHMGEITAHPVAPQSCSSRRKQPAAISYNFQLNTLISNLN